MPYNLKGSLAVAKRIDGGMLGTPAWAPNTAYAQGDVVRVAAALYVRQTAGTSTATWDLTEQANWAALATGSSVTVTENTVAGTVDIAAGAVTGNAILAANELVQQINPLGIAPADDLVVLWDASGARHITTTISNLIAVAEGTNGIVTVTGPANTVGNAVRSIDELNAAGALVPGDDLIPVFDASAGAHVAATVADVVTAGTTNALTATGGSEIVSTVNGVDATLTPPAGTIDTGQFLGFSAAGALVTGSVPSGEATTASNGLTLTGTDVKLGGTLTDAMTTITTSVANRLRIEGLPTGGTTDTLVSGDSLGTLRKINQTNTLTAAAADTFTSTVNGVAATLAPSAGTVAAAKHLGFSAGGALVLGTVSVAENANGTVDVTAGGVTGNAVRSITEQTLLGAAPAGDDLVVVRDTSAGISEHRGVTVAQLVSAGVSINENATTGTLDVTTLSAAGTTVNGQAQRAINELTTITGPNVVGTSDRLALYDTSAATHVQVTPAELVGAVASVVEGTNGVVAVTIPDNTGIAAVGNAVRSLDEQTALGANPDLADIVGVRDTSAGTTEHRTVTVDQLAQAAVQAVEHPSNGTLGVTIGSTAAVQALRAINEITPFGGAPAATDTVPLYMASQSGARTVTIQQLFAANKSYTSTSSDVTVDAVPRGEAIVLVSANTGNRTVNLPAASAASVMTVRVGRYDSSANTLTIVPNGTDTIAGMANFQLAAAWDTITLVADSGLGHWFIFA